MEELFEVMQWAKDSKSLNDGDSSDCDTELFALSFSAAAGTSEKKTTRLNGLHGKQELLILIDLASSASFISENLVQLPHLTPAEVTPIQVVVANGEKLISSQEVQDFSWLTQGCTFQTTVKVLPLQFYDIVLGIDWLECHSPMWVHWKRKIMRFNHMGKEFHYLK
jgi:hypothetical protein